MSLLKNKNTEMFFSIVLFASMFVSKSDAGTYPPEAQNKRMMSPAQGGNYDDSAQGYAYPDNEARAQRQGMRNSYNPYDITDDQKAARDKYLAYQQRNQDARNQKIKADHDERMKSQQSNNSMSGPINEDFIDDLTPDQKEKICKFIHQKEEVKNELDKKLQATNPKPDSEKDVVQKDEAEKEKIKDEEVKKDKKGDKDEPAKKDGKKADPVKKDDKKVESSKKKKAKREKED